MINTVAAGDYKGNTVSEILDIVSIGSAMLSRDTVKSCRVVSKEQRVSLSSAVIRGAIGRAILGPAGLLVGGLSARNVKTYMLEVNWKNGKRSLLEIDERMYKAIMKAMF